MNLIKIFLVTSIFISVHANAAYKPVDHLLSGSKDISNHTSLLILGTGSLLTIGSFIFDKNITDKNNHHINSNGFFTLGNNILGKGYFGVLIGLSSLTAGLIDSNPYHTNAGEAHLEGLFATFIYTFSIKYITNRPRPTGSTDSKTPSFPSGHTSTMFSSAASLFDFYGWKIGTPVLLLATYTGIARVYKNAHYLSDVLFGAALGAAVGHAYSLHHQSTSENHITFMPFYQSKNELGIFIQRQFN